MLLRNVLYSLLFAAVLVLSTSAFAEIVLENGEWSTTYNCPPWNQLSGTQPACDGITRWGDWTCNGKGEQITSAANHPYDGASKGQRHWMGNGKSLNETAPQSGSLSFVFNQPPSELWMRYYASFERGFPQSGQYSFKVVYAFSEEKPSNLFYIDTGSGGNVFRLVNASKGVEQAVFRYGFPDIYGNYSDGGWHFYEFHFDLNSGRFEMWVDNAKRGSAKVDYTAQDGRIHPIKIIVLPENHKTVSLKGCMYYDIDDVAFSTKAGIGPLRPRIGVTGPSR